MADFDTSISSLLCQETEDCFDETEQEDDEFGCLKYTHCSVAQNEGEYMETLVHRETIYFRSYNDNNNNDDSFSDGWFKLARLDAIEWIFHNRAMLGFQIHTAYLSAVYFDQFFSKRSIEDGKLWAIRLLSVACLSLAAKMEECKVPALSEFPVEDYAFESKVIQRMELLVLSTLEWKMGFVTPFAYLHYFISKISGESRNKELVSRAMDLILAMVKEINLVHHRPSAIAAAAVLAASDAQLTRKQIDFKFDFISSWGSLDNEHIFSCYIKMQEIIIRQSKTPNRVISRNPSSTNYSFKDVHENSSVIHGAGIKRKLTFISSDKGSPGKKISRP